MRSLSLLGSVCAILVCMAFLGCPKAPLADITVFPNVANVRVGETTNLVVKSNDPNDVTFAWSSSDDAIASVDGAGIVTGHRAGTATISAVGSHTKKDGLSKVVVTGAISGKS